jgi:outer membrane protein
MRREMIIFTVLLLGLFVSGTIVQATEVRIGYVELEKVLQNSKKGQEKRKVVQEKGTELNNVIKSNQQDLKALKQAYEKKALMLSEDARKEKEREYQQRLKEFERLVKDSREELKRMEVEITTEMLKEIQEIINKIAKKEKYSLILEKNDRIPVILFASESLDITDKVIKAFDAGTE